MKHKQKPNIKPSSVKPIENAPFFQGATNMNSFSSTLRTIGIRLWHIAVVALGICVLALWIAALWIEQMLGHLPPLIVAALPEKYHRVLLSMAATTVRARNAMNQKEE